MLILSIFVLIYGISFYFSEKLSEIVGISHIITVFTTALFLVFFLFFLARKNKLKKYGISFPVNMKKAMFTIAALLILPVTNICFYGKIATGGQLLITALMVLYTAFSEELLFRGILPVAITENLGFSGKTGIILSNALFAVLHICSLHSADRLTPVQLFTAFGIGLCFSSVKDRTHSIFPAFIIHLLINISYSDYAFASSAYRLIWFTLAIFYFIYGIYYCLTEEEIK